MTMSAFEISPRNNRSCRFFASAAAAALIATLVVGAMEIYVSAPTGAAASDLQADTAPSVTEVDE
jgi:hypothetical protein